MPLLAWIRARRAAQQVAEHVEQLVERYEAVVESAVVQHCGAMSTAEARGYFRARAVAIVGAAIERTAALPAADVPAHLHEAVLGRTVERLVARFDLHRSIAEEVSAVQRRAA